MVYEIREKNVEVPEYAKKRTERLLQESGCNSRFFIHKESVDRSRAENVKSTCFFAKAQRNWKYMKDNKKEAESR